MKNFFFLILGLVIIFGSIFLSIREQIVEEKQIKTVRIRENSIQVEVADTPETRTQGLSDRKMLPESAGMLFVFDSPAQYGFWMKNMNFAIDIVWIDAEMYVVGIEKQVSPETFPKMFYPNQAVKYVLELPAGFSDEYRIDLGQYVTI